MFPDVAVILFYVLNQVITLVVVSVVFAVIFKVLPDAKIRWKDVFAGALVTALLFMLGKFGISFYISKASVLSCYVRSFHENHIHFVDGADGGYTNAASMLKKKLAA